jgi:hypothetical protein
MATYLKAASLISFAILSSAAHAEINRCVKQDGGLLLTDEPCSAGARAVASAEEAEMQPHFFNAREVPAKPKPIQRNLTAPYTNPAIPALTRPAPGMRASVPRQYFY